LIKKDAPKATFVYPRHAFESLALGVKSFDTRNPLFPKNLQRSLNHTAFGWLDGQYSDCGVPSANLAHSILTLTFSLDESVFSTRKFFYLLGLGQYFGWSLDVYDCIVIDEDVQLIRDGR